MASQLESAVDRYFTNSVRYRIGGRSFKTNALVVGFPDRLVILPGGRMFLVELKREEGQLSSKQKHFHDEMASLGLTVVTLYGQSDIDAWVEDVRQVPRTPVPPTRPSPTRTRKW